MAPSWIKMHRRSWKKNLWQRGIVNWYVAYHLLLRASGVITNWRRHNEDNSCVVFADLPVFCLVAVWCCHLLRQYTKKAILANFMSETNNSLWSPCIWLSSEYPLIWFQLLWVLLGLWNTLSPINCPKVKMLLTRLILWNNKKTDVGLLIYWNSFHTGHKFIQIHLDDVRIMLVLVLSYWKQVEKAA